MRGPGPVPALIDDLIDQLVQFVVARRQGVMVLLNFAELVFQALLMGDHWQWLEL